MSKAHAPKPRIVVTVHGIQTTGLWQKKITPQLAKHGLIPYHIDFGWFDALRFFLSGSRNKKIEAVRKELQDLIMNSGANRLSIVAHSFGTYIVMQVLMRENGGLKYDRVILSGSILPRCFDWKDVIEDKRWVMAVKNERADGDWVVSLASFVSRYLRWVSGLRAGNSGKEPFEYKSPKMIDSVIMGGHSSTHNVAKFERWARFLAYPHLPADILQKVTEELEAFREEVAKILVEQPRRIRLSVFAPIDGALRIVPGATVNMKYVPEFDLKISPDHGATGTAFQSGSPCLIVKTGKVWDGYSLPGTELNKIHPDLKWVLSIPIRNGESGAIVAVLSVDGIQNVPALIQSNGAGEDRELVMLALSGGIVRRIAPCLEAAFRGDDIERLEV